MKNFTIVIPWFMLFSLATAASPQIKFIGPARNDVLEIVITAGKVNIGKQIHYNKKPDDTVREFGHNRYLFRQGKKIGVLVGKDSEILTPFDTFEGQHLDTSWADQETSYSITSSSDAHYQQVTHPSAVFRKHAPIGVARVDDWKFSSPIEYHIYLILPYPLQDRADYRISFQGDTFPTQKLTFDPLKTPSLAIHVSQIGFHPEDSAKVAFISCWTGSGGGLDYPEDLTFHLIDDKTDAIVHTGRIDSVKSADQKDEDAYKRNFNLTNVYRIDFSDFKRPGRYRLCIQGIGCSYTFDIDSGVWTDAFRTSARGFYHQRSGIALVLCYT